MRIWIITIAALLMFGVAGQAQVPKTFTYQGVLTDALGNPVADGEYTIRFKLFSVPTGGTALWTETKPVICENGLFSTILGDVTTLTLPFDQTYWLELLMTGEPAMTPRTKLTAVPYAIHAMNAGAGGDDDWVINGDDIYHTDGQVAVGALPLGDGGRLPTDPKFYVKGTSVASYSVLSELNNGSDDRSAVYALRERNIRNDGSGFGLAQTNTAMKAYNSFGDSYTFGIAGYTDFDYAFTGAVLGANESASTWGALAYRDGGGANWGLYTPGAAKVGATLVTNYFQMPNGHSNGRVLTCDSNGFGTWQTPAAGFELPYSGSVSTNGPAFEVENTYVGTTTPAIKGHSAGYYGGMFTANRSSSNTHAVHGVASPTGSYDAKGVYGYCRPTENYGYGGWFEGGYQGVYGYCNADENNTAHYYGVQGVVDGTYGYTYGVRGMVNTGDGINYGVRGSAHGLGQNYGVYGAASNGIDDYAGYFAGNTHVTGTLSKSAGSFKIDHPLDPENKYLSHSFVESPDMMNVYNGNIVLDAAGAAWVTMPDWFETLNRDFRYQLTAIGGPGPNLHVAQKIEGNQFQIAGGTAGLEVSWQVTGIRQDPYAKAHPIKVEEDKRPEEQGKYLHPTLYGQSEEQGLHRAVEDDREVQ